MEFLDETFPLIVCISPRAYDDASVDAMIAGFERYLAGEQRYAIVTHSPRDADPAAARHRKRLADWANSGRVRRLTKERCVGSATVVQGALERGALTALLWIWTPPSPHHVCATPDEAIDWCLARLATEKIPLPRAPARIRDELLTRLRSV